MANTALDEDLPIYNMAEEAANEDESLNDRVLNMQEEAEKEDKNEPGFWDTVGDVFVQGGRGALKLFTWPADVLKLGMVGEGLSDLDEIEEAFKKENKPFDREAYVRSVFDQAQYIPTQELAEKSFEDVTGLSLQPKSELGKAVKQGTEIAAFTRGGGLTKLISAATGVVTTQALKASGIGENKAELIGDVASLSPSVLEKAPKVFSKAVSTTEQQARKYGLPFLEFMTKERSPFIKGRITENAEKRLMDQFKHTSEEALDKIITGEIPLKRYQDRGVNLDTLGERAYSRAERKAAKSNSPIKTDDMVKNIDAEIGRIKGLAPSPSDSQKAAIELLERERDILKVSKPTQSQVINQHRNYNADMKVIYRKPEFSGKEEQVRKTYEFLKDQLVSSMEKQGGKDAAEAFKLANKIHHQKSKIEQTQAILEKAFDGEKYNPKKLHKILHSKEGNYLRRNIGKNAVAEIEEIAKYGQEAQEKIGKFMDLHSPSIANEIKQWGQLGWAIFMPHNLKGATLAFAPYVGKRIQGYLLTKPATREIYKLTLKHASEGTFNLLKKDFANLEREIMKEYGSIDDFMDDMLDDLRIAEPE